MLCLLFLFVLPYRQEEQLEGDDVPLLSEAGRNLPELAASFKGLLDTLLHVAVDLVPEGRLQKQLPATVHAFLSEQSSVGSKLFWTLLLAQCVECHICTSPLGSAVHASHTSEHFWALPTPCREQRGLVHMAQAGLEH